ncbi:MAG: DUF4326 domain-containing protein [Desulfurellales bacterium]|nr:MAG: DUF4326 domain-containing protein [Desulfurellales bacterium]
MIEVVNLKRVQLPSRVDEAVVVYVGRRMPGRSGSPLANPFKLQPGQTRGHCLQQYREWLDAQLTRDTAAKRELSRLAGIAREESLLLACWCAPALCHADVIKERIEKLLEEK